MTKQDEQKFAVLMALLGTAFETGNLGESKIKLYFEFLEDLQIGVLKQAVEELIRSRKFPSFPTIAEIREAALGGDKEDEDAAVVAWARAKRMLSISDYDSDERINRAIVAAFGSWRAFGETSPESEGPDRAHFVKCFKAVSRKSRRELVLAGGVEARQLGQGDIT